MTRRSGYRLLPILLLAFVFVLPSIGVSARTPDRSDPQLRVIVGLNPGVETSQQVANDMRQRYNGRVEQVYSQSISGFVIELPASAVKAMQRDARVAFVELDQMVQAFDVPTGVQRIEAPQFHDGQGAPGSSYVVDADIAIIDTGIASHPDLHVAGAVDCTGRSFNPTCQTVSNSDGNGHGTHVAGSAAGLSGSNAMGVAPGARLWSVKVLDNNGSGWMSWIIAGVDWVTANAGTIEVANMSLGCQCSSTALDTALNNSTNAGVVYTVAAGNSASDAATFSPAKHPRVIAVSAMADYDGVAGGTGDPTCRTDPDDSFASFSNYGAVVDIAAPGVCIRSTWPGGSYAVLSGTSMASPHVAGAAALYIAENNVPKNSSRWSTVLNGIQSNTWSVPQGHDCGFSGGKSSERMLMLADCTGSGGSSEPGENSPPAATITSPGGVNPVQGSVTIQVEANDDEDAAGTLDVEVRIGSGSWQAATYNAISDRYEWVWDTTTVNNASHVISAQATDKDSATTAASSVTVTVSNPVNAPPTAQIVHPLANSEVSGSVNVQVTASDPEDGIGTLFVEVSIDGGAWQVASYNSTSGYYERNWDTSTVANGTRSIAARVTDSNNAETTAIPVSVNVANEVSDPDPDPTMHVASLTGFGSAQPRSMWSAHVTIQVLDQNGNPVTNALVNGTWSLGTTTGCYTGTNGSCTSTLSNIRGSIVSVVYSVSGVSHGANTYIAIDNLVSTVTVYRP